MVFKNFTIEWNIFNPTNNLLPHEHKGILYNKLLADNIAHNWPRFRAPKDFFKAGISIGSSGSGIGKSVRQLSRFWFNRITFDNRTASFAHKFYGRRSAD